MHKFQLLCVSLLWDIGPTEDILPFLAEVILVKDIYYWT